MLATVRNTAIFILLMTLTACASLAYSPEDTRIQRDVLRAIRTAPDVSSTSITVRVRSGVVTLDGEAQAPIEKIAMIRAALSVDGVHQIIDLLYIDL